MHAGSLNVPREELSPNGAFLESSPTISQTREDGAMDADPTERELAASLELFDRVAVNLDNLQQVVDEMDELTDIDGIVIETSNARYDQLVREFADHVSGLPPIDGFSIDVTLISAHDLGQWRIDAIDVPEALVGLREMIDAPGIAISEYRHRLQRERRQLVRQRAEGLTGQVDALLLTLTKRYERGRESLKTMKIGWHSIARSVSCSHFSGMLS
jgi:hypothetical protein